MMHLSRLEKDWMRVRFSSLDKSQQLWKAYCDAWANFVAGRMCGGGGTIWPLIYAGAAEANTQNRLEEIKGYEPISGWEEN